MKFTIIVPVYNAEKTVKNTLESIKNQTFSDFQAIIVNDGSADNSKSIIEEYSGDARFTILHKENGGIASAYELAFNYIQGDYVTFVDSDDTMACNLFERLNAVLSIEPFDILQFGIRYTDLDGNIKRERIFPEKIIEEKDDVLYDYLTHISEGKTTPSLGVRAFKRTLFEGVNFCSGSIGIDEFLTLYAMQKANNIKFISEIFYLCNLTLGSVCRSEIDEEKFKKISCSYEVAEKVLNSNNINAVALWNLRKLIVYGGNYKLAIAVLGKKEVKERIKLFYKNFRKGKYSGGSFRKKILIRIIRYFPWLISIKKRR